MDNLDVIMVVQRVDGVCFVPADLSAAMGYIGQPDHPEVQRAILDGIGAVRRAGKAFCRLTVERVLAKRYVEGGALFAAVCVDTALLARAARELAAYFDKHESSGEVKTSSVY